MATAQTARLFDQETLRTRLEDGALPEWVGDHYAFFRESMLSPEDFPCYFGVESERSGDALYSYCESTTDPAALLVLRDTLYAYLQTFEEHAERASLVVFFPPEKEEMTEREWNERFWGVLQFLHDHDPEPWPYHIPADPADEHFEFCFGGEPIFPTARAPFYERRRSRYNPHGLELTAQPRKIFAGITGDTAAGKQARAVIRKRLEAYDDVPPHADLGDWGEALEWKQYLLPEGEGSHESCPLEVTKP
jgi:FPC/CPF motif-containing protein YcgG